MQVVDIAQFIKAALDQQAPDYVSDVEVSFMLVQIVRMVYGKVTAFVLVCYIDVCVRVCL